MSLVECRIVWWVLVLLWRKLVPKLMLTLLDTIVCSQLLTNKGSKERSKHDSAQAETGA